MRLILWFRRWPITTMLLVVVAAQTLVVIAFAWTLAGVKSDIVQIAQEAEARSARGAEVVQDVIECLIAQQNDHRVNTRDVHESLAAHHGIPVTPPAPPPLPDLPPGDVACEPFRNGVDE